MLIAYIGVFLIGLTIWQHWRKEISDVLFTNQTDIPRADSGNPLVNQYGQSDPNGQFTLQPGTPGSPPGQTNIVPKF